MTFERVDDVDLNLLRVLHALLDSGSVTDAAGSLHLSPPAVSRALGRLRRTLQDPLFVRSGRRLVPTPRAESLRGPVAEVMARISEVFLTAELLDPSVLERRFTVRADDPVVVVLGLPLLSSLSEIAPRVEIDFLPESRTTARELQTGDTHLAIGVFDDDHPELSSDDLLTDRFVAAVRKGHPLSNSPLTAAQYAEAHHLNVSPRARRRGPIDDALESIGLHRHQVSTVPSFLVAAQLVAATDMVGNLPKSLVDALSTTAPIIALEIPVPLPPVTVSQTWHRRYDHDAGHQLLRNTVAATARNLFATT
jgi:DNA-binding transcriptional LysR family regulator